MRSGSGFPRPPGLGLGQPAHAEAAIEEKIAPVIRQLKDDPEWQRLAAKYE
jgi:polar amino acid transport system substrate-binding protein